MQKTTNLFEYGLPEVELGKQVYENTFYKIVIGYPPATDEVSAPYPLYLVVNKQHDVMETFHSQLAYTIEMADTLATSMHEAVKADAPQRELDIN